MTEKSCCNSAARRERLTRIRRLEPPLTCFNGARPEGFEPPTLGLEVRRSIH